MSVERLTADERETTTLSTDGDDLVRINTTQRRFITKLRKHPSFTEVDSGFYGATEWAEFTIPAMDWNPASGAKRHRAISDARKQELTARLSRMTRARYASNGIPTPSVVPQVPLDPKAGSNAGQCGGGPVA